MTYTECKAELVKFLTPLGYREMPELLSVDDESTPSSYTNRDFTIKPVSVSELTGVNAIHFVLTLTIIYTTIDNIAYDSSFDEFSSIIVRLMANGASSLSNIRFEPGIDDNQSFTIASMTFEYGKLTYICEGA